MLEKQDRAVLAARVREYLARETETEIGLLQAEIFVDFLAEEVGYVFTIRGSRMRMPRSCGARRMRQAISTCWRSRGCDDRPSVVQNVAAFEDGRAFSRMAAIDACIPWGSIPRLASSMKRTLTPGSMSRASSTEKLTQ